MLTTAFANLYDDSFACASGCSIYVLNPESFEKITKLCGHSKRIWCLCTMPNGDLVSGSSDKSIKIWNCKNKDEEENVESEDLIETVPENSQDLMNDSD